MKVLWIVNMVLPELAQHLGIQPGPSGTWMDDISKMLRADERVDLAVATVHGDSFRQIEAGDIRWYLLPGSGKTMLIYSPSLTKYWERIDRDFSPDIVHLHGTEYSHGLSYLRRFPDKMAIVSIQGILSRIKDVALDGLPPIAWARYRTLKECMKLNGMLEMALLHRWNSRHEREIIRRCRYANTVNFWDTSITKSINPDIKCFRIEYNLRKEFYESRKWSLGTCCRHTIFTNPGTAPIKGLHILIKAVDVVRRAYPDVRVRVPGMSQDGRQLTVRSGYAKYIKSLLTQYSLWNAFQFVGRLDCPQMIKAMLSSHTAVIPSAIEGTSLMLREAMFLGVPTVCSFRGGMADFVRDKESGFLYDYPEYAYLAQRIIQLFGDDDLSMKFSRNAISQAERAHDREKNLNDCMAMYMSVLEADRAS